MGVGLAVLVMGSWSPFSSFMFGEFGFGWERLFEIVSGWMKQVEDG